MPAIIYEKPKCMFIRIPKTGSTSIVQGLFQSSNKFNIIKSNLEYPKEMDSLFSFAFIRNPYQRIISSLLMFRNYPVKNDFELEIRSRLTLKSIMEIVENKDITLKGNNFVSKLKVHTIPMTHPFLMLDRAKYIARFENFQEEYKFLADKLNIEVATIPHFRKNKQYDYRDFFTIKEKQKFENLYKTDIEKFYEFENFKNSSHFVLDIFRKK